MAGLIPRPTAEARLTAALGRAPVVVLTGPRQAGKTILFNPAPAGEEVPDELLRQGNVRKMIGIQPSQNSMTRSNVVGPSPPMMIGGCGFWTGFG